MGAVGAIPEGIITSGISWKEELAAPFVSRIKVISSLRGVLQSGCFRAIKGVKGCHTEEDPQTSCRPFEHQ